MVKEPAVFASWLYRPYLDLGPQSCSEPTHVHRIELEYRQLTNPQPLPSRIQRVIPPSFRESLVRETGLNAYNVRTPTDLPEAYWTERWEVLCQHLREWAELQPVVQAQGLKLLNSLCFYATTVQLTEELDRREPPERLPEIEAHLRYSRATARYVMHLDYGTPYSIDEFRVLAERAPRPSQIRFNSVMHLVVQCARHLHDPAAVEHWSAVAWNELEALRPELDDFQFGLLTSRMYRGTSFAPMLRGNRPEVVRQMDLAEAYAVGLARDTAVRAILAVENLHPLLESRTKEAIWLGDLELAEDRARRLVKLEPHDPKPAIELGEVLLRREKVSQAAEFYLRAARHGPPGTAIAWFMAGQCYEALGMDDVAANCYLASLRADPEGVSPARRLERLSRRVGWRALQRWSAELLFTLASAARGMDTE